MFLSKAGAYFIIALVKAVAEWSNNQPIVLRLRVHILLPAPGESNIKKKVLQVLHKYLRQ
jgi:hypothetical protein